ncbi:MAG TPA: TIGR01906 family membrane protein [Anaerolineaceae bacterium]|nr:TIGR01906 family membrane protein [Anaerolineaceae bacterium]HQN03909.1 TIGR01906 family membrane protein [Anaerolineaceae bacterium]HQP08033.1 TIGR01906 family membrane protein [Anaerolineaceae bacterium]
MKTLKKILQVLVTISTPFIFLMFAVRVMLTPLFLQVEYNLPGFPADPYGFTREQRLYFSKISVDYLLNNEGIEFLQNQKIDEGTPLYNARELSHMLDVKILVKNMLAAWSGLLLIWLLLLVLAWRGKWLLDFLLAVSNGGWLTLGLILFLLTAVLVDFDGLFTAFHHLFFVGDTWLFYYSDSLIRLFPMRFWRDAFILTGGVTILLALISALSRKGLLTKKAA